MKKYIKTLITLLILTIHFTLLSLHCQSQTWKQLNSGTNESLLSVYFVDSLTGWVAGTYGGIYKTSDGGKSWTNQNTSILCRLQALTFIDRKIGFAVGRAGIILKTIDGGLNWIRKDTGVSNNIYNSVFFIDKNTAYIVGNLGIILKTIDGGDNWTEQKYVSSYLINSIRSVYFTDTNNGFAVGSNIGGYGLIVRTTDGGENWVVQDSVVNSTFSTVFFPVNDIGYIVSDTYPGCILKTVDAGVTWFSIAYFTGESCYFINANIGFIAEAAGNIYKTENGGKSWVNYNIGQNVFLYDVFFPDKYTGYICGQNGIILKYQDTTVSNGELRMENGKLHIYPNPAINKLNIDYKENVLNTINSIIITNLEGQTICEYQTKKNLETIDISTLHKGIYFIKLTNNQKVIIRKFIKK